MHIQEKVTTVTVHYAGTNGGAGSKSFSGSHPWANKKAAAYETKMMNMGFYTVKLEETTDGNA